MAPGHVGRGLASVEHPDTTGDGAPAHLAYAGGSPLSTTPESTT